MIKEKNVVIKNSVILNLIQDLQRLIWLLRNCVRGRFQIKFGMTNLFNKAGFTLIELLIVILIVAILAAVAVPQYQFAVEKSRALELITLVNAVQRAEEIYYLEHGTYTSNLTKLDIGVDISHLRDLSISISDTHYLQGYTERGLQYVYFLNQQSAAYRSFRGRRECRTPLTASDTLQKVCATLTGKTRSTSTGYYSWVF